MLRSFNFEPSLKLRWCCAGDLFKSQIPVTTVNSGNLNLPNLLGLIA